VPIVSLSLIDALCIDVVTCMVHNVMRKICGRYAVNIDSIACVWSSGWLYELRHQLLPASSQHT